MPKAYYNEFDPYAAEWLRNLIAAGHIAPGEVDQRSIEDVRPSDLAGFTQCHFFAGVGGWSYALRLAGWADTERVWTGSCPCQPFSTGGKGLGSADERHLWPAFHYLIGQCEPNVVFGEQVSSRAGLEWLTGVFADLEGLGYRAGGNDLCAAGTSAPHLRQRIFWVADSDSKFNFRKNLPCGSGTGSDFSVGKSTQNEQERYRRFDELVTMGIGERVASYPEARIILDGIPNRLGAMRGAGNAIVPQVAEKFIRAYMECRP